MNFWQIIKSLSSILIPLIAAFFSIRFLFRRTATLIRTFYGLPDDYKVNPTIIQRLLPAQFDLWISSFIAIREAGDLATDHWARWLGGAAKLITYDGVALYLEKGGKFSRVVGPGFPPTLLERHETIKAAIDLRSQTITRENIETWTKDGIEVRFNLRAEFQIACTEEAKQRSVVLEEGQEATNLRYPYDADAVQRVVENTAIRYDNETKVLSETTWDSAALETATGRLKAYIAGHSIDELLLFDENSPQLSSFMVSEELFESINDRLANVGSQLLSLQIKKFSPVDQQISDKLLNFWKAEKGKINTAREGEANAERIRAKQRARTVAQQDFLNSLIENLTEINEDFVGIDPDRFSEASILLLTQVLEQSVSDPLIGTMIAREVLETLEILREQLDI